MELKNQKLFEVTTISSIIISLLVMILNNVGMSNYSSLFLLPIMILIAFYIIMLKILEIKTNDRAYVFLIPVILLIVSNFLFKVDDSNKFISIFIIPVLLSIFLFMLVDENRKITKNTIKWVFDLFPSYLFSNLSKVRFLKNDNTKKKIKNISIGVIIGLALSFVLLALLSSADAYFEMVIDNVLEYINNIFNFDNIVKDVVILVNTFIIFFSVFINLVENKDKDIKLKEFNINKTIISIVLVSMNLVYLLFVVSEISKLTTNFLNVPSDYTYAQYAREGFFQLLVVSSINFLVTIFVVSYNNKKERTKLINILLTMMLVFSIVLIFNSDYRLFLYIGKYGFTILRLQVILFLLMELVLFGMLFKKIYEKKNKDEFKTYGLILLITYILNVYLCSEWFINILNKIVK